MKNQSSGMEPMGQIDPKPLSNSLTRYKRATVVYGRILSYTVVVRAGGFEPPRVSLAPLPDSRSGVSASCTTRANAEAGVGIEPTYLGLRTQCLNHSATQPRMTARTAPESHDFGAVPFEAGILSPPSCSRSTRPRFRRFKIV